MTNKQNETPPTDSVGYKRPPQAHRFTPGHSGNRNGRPKGTRNFKTDLREELAEIVVFHEGGHELSISKQRALIKRLVASAIGGNARSIATVVSICARAFGDDGGDEQLASEDLDIVQAFDAPRKRRTKTEPASHSFNEQSSKE